MIRDSNGKNLDGSVTARNKFKLEGGGERRNVLKFVSAHRMCRNIRSGAAKVGKLSLYFDVSGKCRSFRGGNHPPRGLRKNNRPDLVPGLSGR